MSALYDLAVIGALSAVIALWVVGEVVEYRARQQRKRLARLLGRPVSDERSSIETFRRAR